MSSILFFAPLLALLCSVAIYHLVRIVANRWGAIRFAKPLGIVAAVVVFAPACMFVFEQLPAAMTYSGRGVSAEEANGRLSMFEVPAAAINIDYRHSFFDGTTDAADFDLAEADFLQWMADNRRQPAAFTTKANRAKWTDGKSHPDLFPISVTPVVALLDRRTGDWQIDNGYYFDDYDRDRFDDSGLTIVYDSDKQRAYVWRTTF